VRDWLLIDVKVDKPQTEHPKRPIQGFACSRSEVSGRRLWGFFRDHYGSPDNFFAHNFVLNYCPLVFMDESSRNLTPDKMPRTVRDQIHTACDQHLLASLQLFQPTILVGIGNYAFDSLTRVAKTDAHLQNVPITKILHPSPASPASNQGWAQSVENTLSDAGILPAR
jgi:single-strand selective monofunctional uracil DNA glycosylase